MNTIAFNRYLAPFVEAIRKLSERYHVSQLFVFGSILNGQFSDDSDIDFAVIFDKSQINDYFDNYFDFKCELESILSKEIDLVEINAIRNSVFQKELDNTKLLIYEK